MASKRVKSLHGQTDSYEDTIEELETKARSVPGFEHKTRKDFKKLYNEAHKLGKTDLDIRRRVDAAWDFQDQFEPRDATQSSDDLSALHYAASFTEKPIPKFKAAKLPSRGKTVEKVVSFEQKPSGKKSSTHKQALEIVEEVEEKLQKLKKLLQ